MFYMSMIDVSSLVADFDTNRLTLLGHDVCFQKKNKKQKTKKKNKERKKKRKSKNSKKNNDDNY